MPWSKLDFDTQLGGYRVDVTESHLGYRAVSADTSQQILLTTPHA